MDAFEGAKEFSARKAERSAEATRLGQRASLLSSLRLVAVLAFFGLLGGIVWAGLPSSTWALAGALVVAFIVLVLVHARVDEAKERELAGVAYWTNALARMAGDRPQGDGQPACPADHPYADDLDVFGHRSLMSLVDQTRTALGRERLASWLSGEGPLDVTVIAERAAAVKELGGEHALRERMYREGTRLGDHVPDPRGLLAWAEAPDVPISGALRLAAWVLPPVAIVVFVLGTLGLVHPRLPLVPFALCYGLNLITAGLTLKITGPASARASGLREYARIIGTLSSLSPRCAKLKSLVSVAQEAQQGLLGLGRTLDFLDARENAGFRLLIAPLLLWDLHGAIRLSRFRTAYGRKIRGWLTAVAEAEALASLASLAAENPDWAFPEVVAEPCFEAEALGHPLLAPQKRVCNDVTVGAGGHALLITGSNMAGKSTLLRAMGLATVLALAGAPVCAKRLRVGCLRVATSMRIRDSLEGGASRFFAELLKLKQVLKLVRDEKGKVLFLLDEILSGTNTRERIIGAQAFFLELLQRGALGAVSTHDLALAQLEGKTAHQIVNVHFQEQIEGDTMTFDYKLRPGVVASSNALKLMAMVGLDVLPTEARDEGGTRRPPPPK